MDIKRILSLAAIAAGLLPLGNAPSPAPTPTSGYAAAAPSSCDDEEAKARLYQKFLDNFKGNVEQQKVAYETGKEYLSRYGSCPKESDKKVADYVRKWVAKYEEAVREWERWKRRQQ